MIQLFNSKKTFFSVFKVNMTPLIYKLKNGIRCLIYNKDCFNISSILILVKSGSINEPPTYQGTSHFLEHMFFKGTHKRLTQFDIASIIDKYGGVLNAYTDKEHTGYYININNEHFKEAFDVLGDMITNSLFMDKELQMEKKVVLNEMYQRLSNPSYQNTVNFYETIFKGHKLEHRVIGENKDINNLNRASLLAYLFYLYTPKNIVVAVAGKVNVAETKKMMEKTFGQYDGNIYNLNVIDKKSPHIDVFNKHIKLLDKYNKKKDNKLKWNSTFKLEINPKIKHIFVLIGFPGYSYHNKNKYITSFITYYLSKGMSSVLFQQVRVQRGLVYGISSYHKTFNDAGVYGFKFSVKDVNRLVETLYIILKECQKLTTTLLDDDSMAKIRTGLTSGLSFLKDSSNGTADFLGIQYLNHPNSVKTPEEVIDIYKKVTPEQIRKVAQEIFDLNKIQTCIVSHTKFKKDVIDKVVNKVKGTQTKKKSIKKKTKSKTKTN